MMHWMVMAGIGLILIETVAFASRNDKRAAPADIHGVVTHLSAALACWWLLLNQSAIDTGHALLLLAVLAVFARGWAFRHGFDWRKGDA